MKTTVAYALFATALPLFGQYAGPAILSRGESPSAMSLPDLKFRPYLSLNGIYTTGLSGVSLTDTGEIRQEDSFGERLAWGVSGSHNWRRTRLGLDYHGSASLYSTNSYFDSIDHSFLLGLTHQVTRHITFSMSQTAGIVSRDFGLLGMPQTLPVDPSQSQIPTTDYFDNRTIHAATTAALSYQKSTRLFFGFGGGGFYTLRRSRALNDGFGEHATADVQYRLTRRTTIGAVYSYGHFGYGTKVGNSDMHGVAGTFSRSLTRFTEFSAFAGAMRVESKFLHTVQIDPVIVALLGITQGTRISHGITYAPNFGARISQKLETGVLFATVGQTITPGNGLFLTSRSTSASVGYNYSGLRRWSVALNGSYNRSESIGNIIGEYASGSGSVSASRTLRYGLSLTFTAASRKYLSGDFDKYNRLINTVTAGIAWSPGEVPLRIW